MNITEKIEKYLKDQTPYPEPVDSNPTNPLKAKRGNLKRVLKKMSKQGRNDNLPFRAYNVSIHETIEKYFGEQHFPAFNAPFQVSGDTMTNSKPGKKIKKKKRKYMYDPTPVSGMEAGVGSTSSGTPGVRAG